MSDVIICKSCQTANALGSKFCNNCGDRLPPGTKILCPHCGKPNPHTSLYCDHCGKRLSKEPLSEKPSPQKPKSGREMFSLPARPPDQVFSLGADRLPKWDTPSSEEEPEPSSSPEFHTLEDIAPLQKSTDELPTWLVDKLDSSDPGFEPPKEITTDHFLELLQASGEKDDKATALDQLSTGDQPDLPDWLQNAIPATGSREAKLPQPAKSPSTKTSSTGSLPDDWLADLEDEADGTMAGLDQPDTDSKYPDWLAGLADGQGETPSSQDDYEDETTRSGIFDMSEFAEQVLGGAELPTWLDEAESVSEPESQEPSISGIFRSDEFAEEVQDALDNELPDWLNQLGPAETAHFSAKTAVEDDSDWLQELGPAQTAPFGAPTAESTPADWLEELEYSPTTPEPPAPPSAEEEEGDWLAELEVKQSDFFVTPAEQGEGAESEVDEWFAESRAKEDAKDSEPPDWLNELGPAYTAQLTPKALESNEPADWLAELGPPQTNILPESDKLPLLEDTPEILSDIFRFDDEEMIPGWLEEPISEVFDEAEIPWLAEVAEKEAAEAGDFLDAAVSDELAVEDAHAVEDEFAASDYAPEQPLAGEEALDWLSELTALGPDAFSAELPDLIEKAPAEAGMSLAEDFAGPPSFSDDEPLAELPPAFTGLFELEEGAGPELGEVLAEFTPFDEVFDFGEKEGEAVPDWLTELGLPPKDAGEPEVSGEDLLLAGELEAGELPDWVASMKPDTETPSSHLAIPVIDDDFGAIPETLEKAELPFWMEGAPAGVMDDEQEELASGIPEWLQLDQEKDTEGLFEEPVEDVTGVLSALLEALPPSRDPTAGLAKAELPEWLLAMKPSEFPTGSVVVEAERPLQESGPLSGIRGVISIEPVISKPHEKSAGITPFTITPAQKEQASLLRQIQTSLQDQVRTLSTERITGASTLVRTLLALLLLAAIFTGIFGPSLIQAPVTPARVIGAYNTLEAAAGRSVVVAFEYSPAMAAELNPQAALLLGQLEQNGSTVITVSQFAAGLALAAEATRESGSHTLGFIPGEAIGLRELGNCLQQRSTCQSLATREIDAVLQAQLDDVALVIILTGERSSLINWIEQVGAAKDIPVIAGVTQALAPVAAPYAATNQLAGVIAGLPDTAVYGELVNNTLPHADRQLNALHLAQLLAVLLLLIGALISGFSGKKQA